MTITKELKIDPELADDVFKQTGIFIRAKHNDNWGNYDIYQLTPESLLDFLRSRGGENRWAEGTVFALLGKQWPTEVDDYLRSISDNPYAPADAEYPA